VARCDKGSSEFSPLKLLPDTAPSSQTVSDCIDFHSHPALRFPRRYFLTWLTFVLRDRQIVIRIWRNL